MIASDEGIEQSVVLQKHMGAIVDACLELQPRTKSILLYGGFGRDEGSWFKDGDSEWRPYNDYDLRIVSETEVPAGKLQALGKVLAGRIGINWIDLGQARPDQLRRLKPTIFNYDLKYATKVIYGDAGILEVIPEFRATDLTMEEAELLFFTRLYTLIGSLGKRAGDARWTGEASRFFRNQMAKAVLAIVDVLLLAKGAYDSSYRKRVARVSELYSGKGGLIRLSRWALGEKLRPQAPVMGAEAVWELYGTVHSLYFEEMYRGLTLRFGRSVGRPEDLESLMMWRPKAALKRLWWLGRFRDRRMERQLSVLLAQAYIAAAWNGGAMHPAWLARGIALMRMADGKLPRGLTWDEARLEAARLRMEV